MKYKIGDKVRIIANPAFHAGILKEIANLPNREATIKGITSNTYNMKEIGWWWDDEDIECLVIDPKERILSRFDILDIR